MARPKKPPKGTLPQERRRLALLWLVQQYAAHLALCVADPARTEWQYANNKRMGRALWRGIERLA